LCFARDEIALAKGLEYRALVRILLAECIYTPELTLGIMAEIHEKEGDLNLFIKDAIADGKLQDVEPGYAATQFKGIIKGIAFWPQVMMNAPSPDDATSEQLAQDAVMMFLARYAKHTKSIIKSGS
jgi:TetR/AcrR family transcriptional regulator of autoinduction and epiphytic fitness